MAAPASQSTLECALCSKKATSRCGGCRNVWMCSPKCQKTLWRIHKHLCKADPDTFHQAPLTKQELSDLDKFADDQWPFNPVVTIRAVLLNKSGLDDWTTLASVLQSSAWDPPRTGKHGDPREVAILYARQNLGRFYGIGSIAAIETHPPMYAWSMHAEVVYSLLDAERNANPRVPDAESLRKIFTQLNAYLRIMIVQMLAGELVTSKEPIAGMAWRPLVVLAEERYQAELKKATVHPDVRDVLDKMAQSQDQMRRVFGGMGGTGPGLHP